MKFYKNNTEIPLGIYTGYGQYIKTILYGDNLVVVETSKEVLQNLVYKLNKTAKIYNFKHLIRKPR
jgi:hypothetical protein